MSKNDADKRLGKTSKNTHGSCMKIVEYNSSVDVVVLFENGFKKRTTYTEFKSGLIFNPLDKTNYNIGYFGVGIFDSTNKFYSLWKDMFKRCYNEKYLCRFPSYVGCSVCEQWHNYQNFAKWCCDNYYTIENTKMELDKDILVKGNKIYSQETSVFVPKDINCLFIKRNKCRGLLPLGVYLHSDKDKFVAQSYDINKKMKYLGRYNTPEEAFSVYKKYKEDVIKQVADHYKSYIPNRLYESMYKYEVEITD